MFNVGDKVIVVNADSVGDYYKNGDIGVVSSVDSKRHGYVTRNDGVEMNVYWSEVELYKESQQVFKVGDRVKFKKSSIDSGMIDAAEDDVFHVASVHNEHFGTLLKLEGVISAVNISHLEHVKEETMNNTEEQEIKWEGSQIDWQVGQTVWDVRYGKGIVDTLLVIPGQYPIGVVFTDGSTASYTSKGLNRCTDVYRSLFFSEPVITAELFPPKKPFVPTLKKGDKIFIRTKSGIFPEGVVREVFSEVEDRVYISEDMHYFMKYDIESIHILGEEIKFQ